MQFKQLHIEAWKSQDFNAFITAKIIACLISNQQFNIWNVSYITSYMKSIGDSEGQNEVCDINNYL